jgi:hypothetical protein
VTIIEGLAYPQTCGAVEERNSIRGGRVPAKLRKAAQHTLGYRAPIAATPYFVGAGFVLCRGQPGSRLGHRDKAALFNDRPAAPDDLQLIICTNINISKPYKVGVRMRANTYYFANCDTFCAHAAKASSLVPPQTAIPEDHMRSKAVLARRTYSGPMSMSLLESSFGLITQPNQSPSLR